MTRARCTSVYLVRHPAVDLESKSICYGDSDVRLAAGWESKLEPLGAALSQLPIDQRAKKIWHSDLFRCSEPAQWLGSRLGVETLPDSRLRERFFGTWQTVAWSEIPLHEVERAHDMLEHPSTFRPGGGETTDEVSKRALSWWNAVVANADPFSKTIVAIAHSGSITSLCGTLLKLPPSAWTPYYLKPSQHLVIRMNDDQVEITPAVGATDYSK